MTFDQLGTKKLAVLLLNKHITPYHCEHNAKCPTMLINLNKRNHGDKRVNVEWQGRLFITTFLYFNSFHQTFRNSFQLLKIFSVFLATLVTCFYQRTTKRGFTLIISMNSYIIFILSSLLCCSQSLLFHFFISPGKHRKHLTICREVPQDRVRTYYYFLEVSNLSFLFYFGCMDDLLTWIT